MKALLSAVLVTLLAPLISSKRSIYIGCISPMTGKSSWWGRGISVAADMAFDMINNKTDILPDYEIIVLKNDSKGETGLGNRILFDYLNKKQVTIVLGPARSNVATSVADTSKYWKLVQISASATFGDLSKKDKYPYFLRTIPPSSAMRTSFVTLAKSFGWQRVSILFYYRDMQVEAASKLRSECKKNNITVMSYGSYSNKEDASTQIKHIKDIDSRIIFGLLQLTTSVMCQIFDHGMFGRQYAWIIHTPDKYGWWNRTFRPSNCKREEISEAAQHIIVINDMTISKQNMTGISGLSPAEFLTKYNQYAKVKNTITSLYGAFAFDAAWMIALALNKTFSRSSQPSLFMDERYYKDESTALTITNNIIQTEFMGVTGFVHLDENGDRYGHFEIMQIQDNDLYIVGAHDVYDNKVTLLPGKNFLWKGGYPPSDHRIVYPELVEFPRHGLIGIGCLSSSGIILSLFFLYFNIFYRQKRFIKMSSPNINNLIIFGCILAYISVVLFALDGEYLNNFICQVRIFTLNIGFTLAFGAMFSKTWRVHRITRKLRAKKRRIKDVHLLGMVMTFLVVDVSLLVTLTIISPVIKDYHLFDSKSKSPTTADVIYRKKVAYCKMDHVSWLVIVYGTKTLLLVFGLFLAWETRKVKINALNDSQNTGMAVYNVVVTCFVGIPIQLLMSDELYEICVIISTFCILSSTTITLCLVFVPKVRRIFNSTADELTIKDNISINKAHFDSCQRVSCSCNCHLQERVAKGSPATLQNFYTSKVPDKNISFPKEIQSQPSCII